MNLDPKSTIAGYPVKTVRNSLREMLRNRTRGGHEQTEWDEMETAFLNNGLLGKDGLLTKKGSQVANASFLKRMPRKAGLEILTEFLKRVQEVEANNQLAFKVGVVVLFGSLGRESETIGDVDIGYDIIPRAGTQEEFSEALDTARDRLPGSSWLISLGAPEMEVRRYLKNRKARLSLHSIFGGDQEIILNEGLLLYADTRPGFQKDRNETIEMIVGKLGKRSGPSDIPAPVIQS